MQQPINPQEYLIDHIGAGFVRVGIIEITAAFWKQLIKAVFRRQRTRPEVRFDPDLHDREDSGARPDRDLETSDEGRLLAECLDRLKPDPREVIVNHYGLGMTTREIGIVMGMAEATVKSHLQRGRKQLLKLLVDGGMERGLSQDADQLIRETVAREDGWQVLGRGRDVEAGDDDG